MKRILLFCFLGLSTACSSLSAKVFKQIQRGDSKEKVLSILGTPEAFGQSSVENSEVLYFSKRGDRCEVHLINDEVENVQCDKDPSYVSPWTRVAAGLRAAGQSLSNSSPPPPNPVTKPVNCNSYSNGNYATTNCY